MRLSFGLLAFVLAIAMAIGEAVFAEEAAPPTLAELEKAVEEGHVESMFLLGARYADGNAVEQDWAKAKELFEQAIEKGHAEAMFRLGDMYRSIPGVEQDWKLDWKKAKELYEQAIEAGHAEAMFCLGNMYSGGIVDDDDVVIIEQDWEKTRELYEKAAINGSTAAAFEIGALYMLGIGVDENPKKAIEYLGKAAEKDHLTAMYLLGVTYTYDHVDKDLRKMQEWWEKASDKGYGDATFHIALMYANGIDEYVEKDIQKAIDYYEKAAGQKHSGAMFYLAQAHTKGDILEKNLKKAREWYTNIIDNNDFFIDEAKEALKALEREEVRVEEDIF